MVYYLPIIPEDSRYVVTSMSVNIKLKKELKDSWPRLTYSSQRLPWVRPDFDRYQFQESDLEDDEDGIKLNVVHPSKEERVSLPTCTICRLIRLTLFSDCLLYSIH
ncbi:unnamed protein product [Trichobilharzia regenti]|nr:unnamed protein product [Trichobilharzia regenti]